MSNRLQCDLDHVLGHTEGLWDVLRGQRLFITGGTGFFGCWLLESFLWATTTLNLEATATVLTRDPEGFRRKAPHLATHPAIQLHAGDVRSFQFPDGPFAHILHAAAEASVRLNADDPLIVWDTIVEGTRHTLDFARRCHATNVLFISSGAVYGPQPSRMTHLPEDVPGVPDPMSCGSANAEGKRAAELLCALYAKADNLAVKIARCFTFVGPYQPLDAHWAIGNFIRDGLGGGPIQVQGDGTPYRSYLYAADLTVWLWTILLRGQSCRPYNVGSEHALTIGELAHMVAGMCEGRPGVAVAQQPVPGRSPARYVPSTQRARSELGLRQTVSLEEALKRSLEWHDLDQNAVRPMAMKESR